MIVRTSVFAACLFLGTGCGHAATADDPDVSDDGTSTGSESVTFGGQIGSADAGDESQDDGASSTEDADEGTGAPSGQTGLCATAASDPAAAATVGGYLDKLGSQGPKGTFRSQVIDTVVRACDAFGPPPGTAGWKRNYCWAHLTSEILKESSYNQASVVVDAYAKRAIGNQTANDPTLGLMQIRFSSVVHDFVSFGPKERLSCVGCTLPSALDAHKSEAGSSSFWAVSGPSANRSLVQSVSCNIGLGAWYVYLNATSNGKSSGPTYVADYCVGKGTAANLVTGLRAFLEGPTAAYGVVSSMSQAQGLSGSSYINAIKTTFDSMVGPVSGTHPFFLSLAPRTSTYCR